jgi:hypothetical protein
MQVDDIAKYMRIGKIMKTLNDGGNKGRDGGDESVFSGENSGESRDGVHEEAFANLPRRRMVRNDQDKLASSKKKKVSAKELATIRQVGIQPEELLGKKDKAALKKDFDEWQEEYGNVVTQRAPEAASKH